MLNQEFVKIKDYVFDLKYPMRFVVYTENGCMKRERRDIFAPAVYLGGPIEGLSYDEAALWRLDVTNRLSELGFEALDPMRRDFREILESGTEIDPNEIVIPDKWDIMQSDMVLVNYSQRSTGTAMEIIYAYTYGIPVIVADTRTDSFINPWVAYHATTIHMDLEDAIQDVIERCKKIDEKTV